MRSFDRNSLLAWIALPMAIVAYPFYRAKYKLSHLGSRKDGISEMAEDPQWGKRGGGKEGPPDLDEILRKFNQKLGNLFGGKGGGTGNAGGGAGSGGPTAAMMGGGFVLAAGLAVSMSCLTNVELCLMSYISYMTTLTGWAANAYNRPATLSAFHALRRSLQ